MSVNLLDMVKGAVSDQNMGHIGEMLGQSDTKKTSLMFETAVQSLLGGLIQKASSRPGSEDVYQAVQDQDNNVLERLGDILGGGVDSSQGELKKSGGGILDLIFGENQNGIVDAIAKFLGVDGTVVGKLLKLAGPIIFGVIAKHVKAKALDAVGLGSVLGDQKSLLNDAMPSSLSHSLGMSEMLESRRETSERSAQPVSNTTSTGGSFVKFLIPIALLGVLAYLGYAMLTDIENDGGPSIEMPDVEDVNFGEFNLDQLRGKFANITTGFQDVTKDNVTGLANEVTDLTNTIGTMGLDQLEGPEKNAAGEIIEKFIDSLKESLESITNSEIMEVLKPVVNALIEKLNPYKSTVATDE